jgi:hypothetical protein
MANHWRAETHTERALRDSKQREHERDYTDPEKHYVRKHAWVPTAQARLNRLRGEGTGDYLRYFTLCAEKAIDVHLFGVQESLVRFDGKGYPDVVFCECYPDQFEAIQARLDRTTGILGYFEDLVLDASSEQSQLFTSELPFDIYNLDFTGVCFPRAEPPFSRTLDAIVTLVERLAQPQYQKGFDIFLTFRAQRSQENEDAIRQLRANVQDNRSQYDWFDDLLIRNYGGSMGTLAQSRYHQFLLLSLPKFVGRFGERAGFRLACPHRLCYGRPTAQHADFYIISFVLTFDWEGEDTTLRRSLRQSVPAQEARTEAYLRMLRNLVEQDICNVGTTRFARERYKQEVRDLLALVEDF